MDSEEEEEVLFGLKSGLSHMLHKLSFIIFCLSLISCFTFKNVFISHMYAC